MSSKRALRHAVCAFLFIAINAIAVLALHPQASAFARRPYYDSEADAVNMHRYYAGMDTPALTDYARLHELISKTHRHQYNYNTSRKTFLYPIVDRWPDGKLRGIYTNRTFETDDYNCEHTVPQSFFGKKEPMKGDMHHLFTADMKCNSFRSNYVFIDLSANLPLRNHREMSGCGRILIQTASRAAAGSPAVPDSTMFFEPMSDASKAAVSRAFLYFLVRYRGAISRHHVPEPALDVICRWAANGEVVLWEKHRNAELHEIQGNRNPFIDMPWLALKLNFTDAFNMKEMPPSRPYYYRGM